METKTTDDKPARSAGLAATHGSQKRLAIAAACGLMCGGCNGSGIKTKFRQSEYAKIRESNPHWLKQWPKKEPDLPCSHDGLPDYLNDLNAMHEAEKVMEDRGLCVDYVNNLRDFSAAPKTMSRYGLTHATATQRADAFLKTISENVRVSESPPENQKGKI